MYTGRETASNHVNLADVICIARALRFDTKMKSTRCATDVRHVALTRVPPDFISYFMDIYCASCILVFFQVATYKRNAESLAHETPIVQWHAGAIHWILYTERVVILPRVPDAVTQMPASSRSKSPSRK